MPDLGSCCHCGRADGVRNIVMLARRGPVPGHGWGCVVCGLPPDGAIAVLCDDCVDVGEPRFVCAGYAAEPGRAPWADLSPEPFEHDRIRHLVDDLRNSA